MTIKDMKIGESAIVTEVGGKGALRQHFLDMGVIPGTAVKVVKYAPMGDPVQLMIHGYDLTLRIADADKIEVTGATENEIESAESAAQGSASGGAKDEEKNQIHNHVEHPGLGEGGRYHDSATEHPLPEGTQLTFALAGNQNSGKTTLFNQLTGANQHVGNFPGVTVDRKDGMIRGIENTLVTDLPGIYSMSPYTSEEIVTRQFILQERPKGIINIVDATNIERNLYLTMQLMEIGIPMVLAVNMMDEMRGNGGSIRINKMEEMMGIPVVPIAAASNEGIDELIDHAIHVARYQEKPGRQDFCGPEDHGGAVHRCIHSIMHLIEDHCAAVDVPVRFAATKVIEGDQRVIDALGLDQNEKEACEHLILQMEKERGLDRAAAIADMRYTFIQKVCDATVVKPHESIERKRSIELDKVLTGKYTAIPCFIGIMLAIFFLTFNVIGAWLQGLLEMGIGVLTDKADAALTAFGVNEVLHSLIIKGIFNGVGSVLSFLPLIVVLFFFLSILEDSGYMARIAFVMDKPLRRIGLSGRSIVPMLMGFGCTVPGVMATRTLPSERDRKMTILLTPYMSCNAKMPIYGLFAAAFFGGKAALVYISMYVLGILCGLVMAFVTRKFLFKGEAMPFVMELPNYRMPTPANVARLLWDKAKDFVERAFSVIFIATLLIWFLQTFSLRLNMVSDSKDSILAALAGVLTPLLKPLGFGDWRICVALIAGFMAKESVVSTLSVLFGSIAGLQAAMSPSAAVGLLVFCLLYTPCVAAVSSFKRELGGKWALGIVAEQCLVAWIAAFIVRLISLALGLA